MDEYQKLTTSLNKEIDELKAKLEKSKKARAKEKIGLEETVLDRNVRMEV